VLKLRRGEVVAVEPLTVRIDGEERTAWADEGLVGEVREGDDVIVNTEAVDLELGSGGFDVVHVNLTRGLAGEGTAGSHVMKLNYSSLQHPVEPIEVGDPDGDWQPASRPPAAVIFLHGQLAPLAWAASQEVPDLELGFVQTAGGALPGSLSRDVRELRDRGLLAGHITVSPCYGGEREAISVTGALHAAAEGLGWDAIVAGPGPGILGSASRYGHGGMAALDSAHAAIALGLDVVIAPRLSAADERIRHRGLSHHTKAVLRLLLAPVSVAAPEGEFAGAEELRAACGDRHRVTRARANLAGYAETGLPAKTMGRTIDEDPDFYAGGLAAGQALGGAVARSGS
jgi:hypothetical protein